MKVVRGIISHSGIGSTIIPESSIVTVTVKDRSKGQVKILGSAVLSNVMAFPFQYEVQYDETQVNYRLSPGYKVDCNIKHDDNIEFLNYCGGELLIRDGELQETVDFCLVNPFYE